MRKKSDYDGVYDSDKQNFLFKSACNKVTVSVVFNHHYGTDLPANGEPSDVEIRLFHGGKLCYLRQGYQCTKEHFDELVRSERKGQAKGRLFEERNRLRVPFDRVMKIVQELTESEIFTFKRLRNRFNNINDDDDTIYTVWDGIINEKQSDGKANTAYSYGIAKKRFIIDMGHNVSFSDIDNLFIKLWKKKMANEHLSRTTVGIYLRSFRVAVGVAIQNGFIKAQLKDIFQDTDYNKSASRKHEFLNVETWTKLFKFFRDGDLVDEGGKPLYLPSVRTNIFRDLGLFLFMYLGDGQNLADTLRLTFNGWYFATNKTQMQFYRHKTRERSESDSEVIFPVTKELRLILDRIANIEKLNGRVFGVLPIGLSEANEIIRLRQENKNIRNHVRIVCKYLGIDFEPSSTWCRHSFATNLNDCGKVPLRYISESMGHASSGNITNRYISDYSFEKMLQYNRYLLNVEDNEETALIEKLKNLDAATLQKILAAIK